MAGKPRVTWRARALDLPPEVESWLDYRPQVIDIRSPAATHGFAASRGRQWLIAIFWLS